MFIKIVFLGYYARVKGMRTLLDQFLTQTHCKCQVINLGAGFDSLFWLLKVMQMSTCESTGIQSSHNFKRVDISEWVPRYMQSLRCCMRNKILLRSANDKYQCILPFDQLTE